MDGHHVLCTTGASSVMTDTKDLLQPPKRIVLGNDSGREWPETAYVREDLHKDLEAERDTLVSAILGYLSVTGGVVPPVRQADGLDKEHGQWPPQEEISDANTV